MDSTFTPGKVPKIKVALFDLAGTTIDDTIKIPGLEKEVSLVFSAYHNAFKKGGIEISFLELNACRGRDKKEVFQEKVAQFRNDLSSQEQAVLVRVLLEEEFIPALLRNIPYLKEMPGTSDTFQHLKKHNVFIAVGSGFPLAVVEAITKHFAWEEKGLIDYATCGEAAGGGRPKPHMINATLVAAGFLPENSDLSQKQENFDYRIILKIGDTQEDIREGNNVGATSLAVLSGTQSKKQLEELHPMAVLPSVAEIPNYLHNHRLIE